LVIHSEDKLLLNKHLPITKQIVLDLKGVSERSAIEQSHALMKFMYYLTMSVNYSMIVNAWGIFETLFSSSQS
jgi:hypothetical protein